MEATELGAGPVSGRSRRDALIVFCLLAICFGYIYQAPGWNGNSRFGLTFAIVQEGRLTIDSFHDREETRTGDKSYFDGHYYSDKAIGPSLIGAALYAPLWGMKLVFGHPSLETSKVILNFLVIGLPSAIAGALMYLLCVHLTGSRFRALVATLAVALGTMYFPYSVVFFSHQLASSLLFGAFFMIFLLKRSLGRRGAGYRIAIGLLLGWAVISEFPTAAIAAPLAAYYVHAVWKAEPGRRLRALALPAIGGLVPIALQLGYNVLCFGSPFSLGYSNLSDPVYVEAMAHGVMGIQAPDLTVLFYTLFHPSLGLLWESPVLLMAPVGAVFLFRERRYRAEAIVATWIVVFYLILMSGYSVWWGGYALGPRHFIPVLAFLCMPLAFVPRKWTWLTVILGLISVAQMTIAAASSVLVPETMVLRIEAQRFFEYSNIYSFCLRELLNGNFARNLGTQYLGLQGWVSLLPLGAAASALIFLFLRGTTAGVPRRLPSDPL
jgi:hypothetical protein